MAFTTGTGLKDWATAYTTLNQGAPFQNLASWHAVIECASLSGAITRKRAGQLRSIDYNHNFTEFSSQSDHRVSEQELSNIPAGAFIAFIKVDPSRLMDRLSFPGERLGRRHIIHAMIALGEGKAAGTNNHQGIGLGNHNKWEIIDLADLRWTNDNMNIIAASPNIKNPPLLRIRYRKLEDYQKGEKPPLSINDLSLELLKRVSIFTEESANPRTPPWELITNNQDQNIKEMMLVSSTNSTTAGAWELKVRDAFSASLPAPILPMYFLPFSSQYINKLEIGSDCNFFVTTRLTGCSIFTKGIRSKPTIYHAGFTGEVKNSVLQVKNSVLHPEPELVVHEDLEKHILPGDSDNFSGQIIATARGGSVTGDGITVPLDFAIKFWRYLLNKLDPSMDNSSGSVQGWSEVNKTSYINDGTIARIWTGIDRVKKTDYTTKAAKVLSKSEMIVHESLIDYSDTSGGFPWGSYIGFYDKDKGEWSMYLQCNITFPRYTEKKSKKKYSSSFPIALIQVYPAGNEKVNLINKVPTEISNPFSLSDTVVEAF